MCPVNVPIRRKSAMAGGLWMVVVIVTSLCATVTSDALLLFVVNAMAGVATKTIKIVFPTIGRRLNGLCGDEFIGCQ